MADMRAKGRAASGDRHSSRVHPERVARGDRNGSRTHPERLPRGDDSPSRRFRERLPRGEGHWSKLKPELVVKGERNGSAKLTTAAVREIREALARGEIGTVIAARHGVTKYAVSDIKRGKSWAHLP